MRVVVTTQPDTKPVVLKDGRNLVGSAHVELINGLIGGPFQIWNKAGNLTVSAPHTAIRVPAIAPGRIVQATDEDGEMSLRIKASPTGEAAWSALTAEILAAYGETVDPA